MEPDKVDNILIPVNFTDSDNLAIKTAVSICKKQAAKLTLIHVVEKVSLIDTNGFLIPLAERMTDFFKQLQNNLNTLANKIVNETHIPINVKLESGKPEEVICKVANESKYSMIIIGSNHFVFLRHTFANSMILKIIRLANCPVLYVRDDWKIVQYNKKKFPLHQEIFQNIII